MSNYAEINYDKNMKMLKDALNYTEKNYSHEEIISVLKEENDIEKQYCLILLDSLTANEEADILVSNLINHSGPVREACSFAIEKLIKNDTYNSFFQRENIYNIFVKSITDINPSVSRNAIEIIKYAYDKKYLEKEIIKELKLSLLNARENEKNKSYDTNKINFNIYWNLEALAVLYFDIIPDKELFGILCETAKFDDYTIRDKTAKIVSKFKENNFLKSTADILRNDENIYVRRHFA